MAWISARIWYTKFYRDFFGNSQRSLLSPTGGVKRIPPDTATHEQNGYAKVKNDNNLIETNVDNDKSDTTHTDMRNMQNWAHLHTVFSVPRLMIHHTPHLAQGRSRVCHPISIPSMMNVSLWVSRLLLLPLPALHHLLPVLPLHALRQLWLHDKQPAQLRQRDLRHLRRFLPAHRGRGGEGERRGFGRGLVWFGEGEERRWFGERVGWGLVWGLVWGFGSCGGVILGQGAKVLSGSTQGIYPRHQGSWGCRAVGTARWSERWWGRRWSEGRSRRDQKQRSQCTWNMKMTMGWTETQTWATVCVHQNKEDNQGTMTLTYNREERLTTKNEGPPVHDGSCIGINYAHKFPKCFKSLHTLLGFSLCTSCQQSNCCSCTHLFNFWPVRKFLVEIHTAKMVLWGLVFTPPSVAADRRQL